MKVIYATNSDLGKHGNIGFRTYQVAKEAYKRKYLKKIISRGNCQTIIPKTFIKKVFPLYRPFNLALTAINQFITLKFPAYLINLNLFGILAKNKVEKCDIFHIYDYSEPLLKKSKKIGNINILDTQMAHPETSYIMQKEDWGASEKKTKEFFKKFKKMLSYADYIVASSDFVIKTYVNAGVPKHKMIKLNHGVDITKFKKNKQKESSKFICLYVGMITNRKGIKYLLEAWKNAKLKNAELIFCGRISPDMKKIVNKNKDNSIKFKGFVDPVKYYQKSDVFIFPSLFESSAKVLYEAMSSSLPIITTENAGPAFKDKEAGFIVPIKDAKSIKNKIKILYNSPKLRDKMGNKGRKITEKLSWKEYGKKMNDFYEKIMK